MNSEITLTNYSTAGTAKGQARLLYKRCDQHNAVLEEDSTPRYFLATSEDGVRKIKIRDATQRVVAEVNRKTLLSDAIMLADRNEGKAMKADAILKRSSSTSQSQYVIALHTEEGVYYWRKRRGHHWALYANSTYTPVAWTETVPGRGPTWELVIEDRASSILDYVLASLFYAKGEPNTDAEVEVWDYLDCRATWSSMR